MRLHVDPGAALSDSILDQMWALRGSVLPLKRSLAAGIEGELVRFRADVRSATHVVRLLDEGGVLLGMATLRRSLSSLPLLGSVVELEAAHLAVARRIRGTPIVLWSVWSTLVRLAWVQEGGVVPRPALLTTVAYPSSAMLLDAFGRVTLWGDAAPPAEAALLDRLRATHVERWDAVRSCVSMRTCPHPPTPSWEARAARNSLYRRFVARCPDWAQGYGLPIAVRLDLLRAMRGLVREGGRRWWRRGVDIVAGARRTEVGGRPSQGSPSTWQ